MTTQLYNNIAPFQQRHYCRINLIINICFKSLCGCYKEAYVTSKIEEKTLILMMLVSTFSEIFFKYTSVSTFIRHKTLILFLFFDACNFSSRLSFYLKFHWGHVESNFIFNLEFTDLPARNLSILIFQIHLVDYFFFSIN